MIGASYFAATFALALSPRKRWERELMERRLTKDTLAPRRGERDGVRGASQ